MKSNHFYLNHLITIIVFSMTMASCSYSPKVNTAKEIEALALLQQQEQKAHLGEEPALLVNMLNDTLTQIKNGVVSHFTKDQMTQKLSDYFYSVEFIKWEDATTPVYTLSEDGTMAYIIVQKHVEVNIEKDSATVRQDTDFAWSELWKKKDGKWKMYSIATTDIQGN